MNHAHGASEKPIGVFDSGVGGLTVVKEIMSALPAEAIVYFGDTARVPYGTKSRETITKFAMEDASFLMSHNVKAIVVACNTVSSNSLPHLKHHFSVPIIGVIEPAVLQACQKTTRKRIGIIGTDATVESNVYRETFQSLCPEVEVFSKSCPLFVPLAEEGWTDREATALIAEEYLSELLNKDIDTIVLGCTHYPILKDVIRQVTGEHVVLIDSALYTAAFLRRSLEHEGLLRTSKEKATSLFFLSDIPRKFPDIAERFLGKQIDHLSIIDITPYSQQEP
jgi:glutamate racemase